MISMYLTLTLTLLSIFPASGVIHLSRIFLLSNITIFPVGSCSCKKEKCIMTASPGSVDDIPSTWSVCSRIYFLDHKHEVRYQCLYVINRADNGCVDLDIMLLIFTSHIFFINIFIDVNLLKNLEFDNFFKE